MHLLFNHLIISIYLHCVSINLSFSVIYIKRVVFYCRVCCSLNVQYISFPILYIHTASVYQLFFFLLSLFLTLTHNLIFPRKLTGPSCYICKCFNMLVNTLQSFLSHLLLNITVT